MAVFKGVCVAMTTPFTETGVDFEAFGRAIEYYLDGGVNALCVCGTTGEPSTMSADERNSVIKFAIDKIGGRVPVIVGCGCNSTSSTVANAVDAEKMGADALLVVTPYYNKCTQRGLIEHYTAVANATTLPVIMYNVPGRTGVNILPETAVKLSKVDNIVAIKEACGNMTQIQKLARLVGDGLDIYLGDDGLTFLGLTLGAKGVISVVANIAPKQTSDITTAFFNGNVSASREAQFKLNPLIDELFCEVNPIPVKKGMSLLGFGSAKPRLPLTEMEEDNATRLEAEMSKLGLL